MPRLRSLLALLVLGLLGAPREAAAAGGPLVIDEFMVRCLDGSNAGAFLELRALVPGQVFDSTLRVRLAGPSGTVIADFALPVGARQGTPWAAEQRFLLASAGFFDATQVAPDGVLPATPSTNGGQVTLYRRVGTGSAIKIIDRFDYSSTGATRTPPAGRSSVRRDSALFVFSSEPSPTNASLVLASAPGCFMPAERAFTIQEIAIQCPDGSVGGRFLELGVRNTSQSFDEDLRLQIIASDGFLVLEEPVQFGASSGQAWPSNRGWLIGPADLVTSFGRVPDQVSVLPLDHRGGRVRLLGRAADGREVVLQEFAYGPNALAPPGPGQSYTWVPGSSTWALTATPTPTDIQGLPHVALGCRGRSSVRIDEILTGCELTGNADQALEFIATSDGTKRDTTLRFLVFDRDGRQVANRRLGFGPKAGAAWPNGTSWLIGTEGLSNALGDTADVRMDFVLDPVAGRVELLQDLPEAAVLLQSVSWGGTAFPAPPLGRSLARTTDTDYRLRTVPILLRSDGHGVACGTLVNPENLTPGFIAEVALACYNGDPRAGFVRVVFSGNVRVGSTLVLRMFDHQGALIAELPRPFGGLTGLIPPGGKSFLFTARDYPSGPGDATLPGALDPLGGSIALVLPSANGDQVVTARDYDPRTVRNGMSLSSISGRDLGRPSSPTPVLFNGDPWGLQGCHLGVSKGGVVSSLMTRCSDGQTRVQFFEWKSARPGEMADPTMGWRVRDAQGRSVAEVFPVFTDPPLFTVLPDRQLVAPAGFEAAMGLAPDRLLSGTMPANGALEMFWREPGSLTDHVLSRFAYGDSLPTRGVAVEVQPDGRAVAMSVAHATRGDGRIAVVPTDCATLAPPVLPQELVLGCFDGDTRGQQFVFKSSGQGVVLDSSYTLRVFDRNGAYVDSLPQVFGGLAGQVLAFGRMFTVGAPGRPAFGGRVDASFHRALDPEAGSIELVSVRGDSVGLVWRLRYDQRALVVLPGMALAINGEQVKSARFSSATNLAGESTSLSGCHIGLPSPPIELAEVFVACRDADTQRQYIMFSSRSGGMLEPDIGLRITTLGRDPIVLTSLFRNPAFTPWPAPYRYLVATPQWSASMGAAPDLELPFNLLAGQSGIELFRRLPGRAEEILARTILVPGVTPGPGQVLRPSGGAGASVPPRPTRFDGRTFVIPESCTSGSGLLGAVRVGELLLGCRDGDTGAQFIELERTSQFEARDPRLAIELIDHLGQRIGTPGPLFGPGDFYWPGDRMVLGTARFQSFWGLPPDQILPDRLDPLGGAIRILFRTANRDSVVLEQPYGTGDVPLPPFGMSVQQFDGAWALLETPVPQGFLGLGASRLGCAGLCPATRYQLSFGPVAETQRPVADLRDFETRVKLDLTGGEFQLFSGFSMAAVVLDEVLMMLGTPSADSIRMQVRLDAIVSRRDTCIFGRCYGSNRRLLVYLDDRLVDSLSASAVARDTLTFRLAMLPGSARRLRIESSTEGLLAYQLQSSVDARWTLLGVPAGREVISCHGFSLENAKAVRTATAIATPDRVQLEWPAPRLSDTSVQVERRVAGDPDALWQFRETRPVDADQLVRFADREVEVEQSYEYRLSWQDRFGAYTGGETTVLVPRRFSYGYFGPRPNPSTGTLSLVFELPEAGEVSAELYDVSGRLRVTRRASLAAGPGQMTLTGDRPLEPGVYLIRFRAAGIEQRSAAVIVR